jgi:hypothetical protein
LPLLTAVLADEYDAAQERDEISKQGAHISDGKMRAKDILPPKQMHEARAVRDAVWRTRCHHVAGTSPKTPRY